MIKIFFALNLLIFLLQTDFEEISKLSKMARKREKTFIQLNWSQNEKAQLEKGMQAFCFFIFGIWNWCQSIQHHILHQEI